MFLFQVDGAPILEMYKLEASHKKNYFSVLIISQTVIQSSHTMVGTKVLVFGGTGPAGICLLRELVYRKHAIIVYARSPSKIPSELAANPLVEVRCSYNSISALNHSESVKSLKAKNTNTLPQLGHPRRSLKLLSPLLGGLESLQHNLPPRPQRQRHNLRPFPLLLILRLPLPYHAHPRRASNPRHGHSIHQVS